MPINQKAKKLSALSKGVVKGLLFVGGTRAWLIVETDKGYFYRQKDFRSPHRIQRSHALSEVVFKTKGRWN